MAKNKTVQTTSSVVEFVNSLHDERKRRDSFTIIDMMKELTGLEPNMWGPSIVGFGSYHYKYESGHEGDAPLNGFHQEKIPLVFTCRAMILKVGRSCLLSWVNIKPARHACISKDLTILIQIFSGN